MNFFYLKHKSIVVILNPLLEALSQHGFFANEEKEIKTIIQLKHRFLVLVGESAYFRVPDISKQELEYFLNILQRSSLITYQSTLSGEAYLVTVKVSQPPSSCSIRPMYFRRKSA